MGRTCHLPGINNHLVANQEKLGRKNAQPNTPRQLPFFGISRRALDLNVHHINRYEPLDNAPFDGSMRRVLGYLEEKNQNIGTVVKPERVVLGLLSSETFQGIFNEYLLRKDIKNQTYRHRNEHYKGITSDISEAFSNLIKQDNNQQLLDIANQTRKFNKQDYSDDSLYIADPGSNYELRPIKIPLETRYKKINENTVGAVVDMSDRGVRRQFENDANIIENTLKGVGLHFARITIDMLDNTIPLFETNQKLNYKNRPNINTPILPGAITVDRLSIVS